MKNVKNFLILKIRIRDFVRENAQNLIMERKIKAENFQMKLIKRRGKKKKKIHFMAKNILMKPKIKLEMLIKAESFQMKLIKRRG